jgi:hypothetical protein
MRGGVVILLLALAAVAMEIHARMPQEFPVAPARVVPMQNFDVGTAKSGRPASIPLSWGRLAAIHDLGGGNHVLIFEAEAGDLRFVRLMQRGNYLYLDTRDQGGVVTVLTRE